MASPSSDATYGAAHDKESSSIPKKTKSSLLVDGQELSVGKRIDQIGFGAYQLQVFLFCAGSLWCEGSQLATISGVKSMVYSEYHITGDFPQAVLILILYIGFACGTIASGTIGDTKGRRLPMLIGYMGIVISQVVLYNVTWLWLVYIFICILGFFAGIGIPAAVTALSEVVPTDYRGVCGAALCIGFSAGELWSAIGLRLFVPTMTAGPWRDCLLWAAIPPMLLLLLGLALSVTRVDSAHFLAAHNKQEQLREALNLIAITNGKPDLELKEKIPGHEGEADVTFSEVCSMLSGGELGVCTVVLSLMFFTFNFGYYGTTDFWPIGWSGMHLKGVFKATELIYTALIGLFGVAVAMFTMSNIDRRPGACFAAVVCAIASICLHGLLHDEIVLGWAGVILFKLFWMTFQMTTMTVPNEIYPTRISVGAWSIICFFGRIGCVIVPVIIAYTDSGFLIILTVLLCMSACAVWGLPETKDRDLEELDKLGLPAKKLEGSSYGSIQHDVSSV